MSLSKEDKELLEWLLSEENKVEFIENFIKINDKNGNLIPFILTKQQKEFVNGILDKVIVLKSRQLGLSVVSLALMLRMAIIYPYTNSKIFSFEQDSANDNFDKLKVMYDNLPNFLKKEAKLTINNREVLKFSNGSTITCKTVGKSSKGKGKGATINGILHLTEFSYYENAHKQLASLGSAVSSSGTIIIESTANGVGNYFHKHYIDAKKGENGYKSFFFSWIEARELFEDDYKKAVERYKAIYGKDLTIDDLDNEEKELMKLGATLDQLTYRRFEVKSNGLKLFHQERPSTDNEAFLTSGESMFETKRIDSVERSIIGKDRQFIHKLKLDNLSSDLKKYYGKEFKIYHDVKKDKKYYIGVDVAEGCAGDYSVIEVYDTEGRECAMFRSNKIKPYQFSKILAMIGRYYNKGFLLVEKASGGHTVISKLHDDFKYQRLYKYKAYDEKNRQVTKWGFDTNPKTKGIIIQNFIEMFETGLIEINSIETLEEMKVFQITDSGKMGALSGFHDDTIMATALALQGIKEGKWWRWI